MAGRAAHATYQVDCPHCGKSFEGELLAGSSPRGSRGFKCPHCRLFVPYERANGKADADRPREPHHSFKG
jgi:DNA-directed RNA polymerase subunit RPC12/RpoP